MTIIRIVARSCASGSLKGLCQKESSMNEISETYKQANLWPIDTSICSQDSAASPLASGGQAFPPTCVSLAEVFLATIYRMQAEEQASRARVAGSGERCIDSFA